MADQDVKSLLLQVDATTELLRRELTKADRAVSAFEGSAGRSVAAVEDAIAGMGKSFGPFAQMASSAAAKAKASFESSFDQIQKLASKAIKLPPIEGGVLNLGAGEMRAAADEANRQAIALGAIVTAAERAAAGEGVLTQETRLYLQAARAAKIEAEQHALQLGREAQGVERLQAELAAAAGQTRLFQNTQARAVVGTGQMRAASQQLSYQISDVATSFAGGINPMIIFAQQGSQVVQAITLMQGEAKGFIGFLGGPWGAALMGAVTVLGVLATKHGDGAKAADAHKKSAKSLEEAIADLNETTGRSIRTSQQSEAQTYAEARSQYDAAIAARTKTKAILDQAIATQKLIDTQIRGGSIGDESGGLGTAWAGAMADSSVNALQAMIAKQDYLIGQARQGMADARVPLLQRQVSEATDASAAATGRYERTLAALNVQLQANMIGEDEYRKKLTEAMKVRDAALDAARASNRKSRKGRDRKDDLSDMEKALEKVEIAARNVSLELDKVQFGDADKKAADHARQFYNALGIDPRGDLNAIVKDIDAGRDQQMKANQRVADDQRRQQGAAIHDMANLYHDLFTGGTKGLWDSFKQMGINAISEVLAKWTVTKLFPGSGGSLSAGLGKLFGIGMADGGLIKGYAGGGVVAGGGESIIGARA